MFESESFWALVEQIMEMIACVTEYPILIYNTNGAIVLATDKSRVGDLHPGAHQVVRGKVAEYAVSPEDAAQNPLIREGFICPIFMQGRIVAGLGIVAELSVAKPVAKLSAKMIEAWIEKHNYQVQLERSEKKYRDIFNHSLHGIYQVTLEGRFLAANKAMAAILGYPDPNTLMTTITHIGKQLYIIPEDLTAFLEAIQNDGQVTDFETRLRHREGGIIDVRINAGLKFDSSTNAVVIEGLLEDVTNRKKAEEELKRNVNFTKALLNAVPTPVFYKDRKGLYQGCNQAFSEVMGVAPDDIRGKSVHQLWPSEHADVYHRNDLELMKNPEHQVYEFKIKDVHGKTRPVIFAKDVFRDENGTIGGLVGAFLDISQLKQTEEELRKAHDIINRSPVVAFRWENAPGWPVEYVSENVEALFGHSAEDFISGRTRFADTLHPDDLERVAKEVRQNSADARITHFNHEPYRIVTKNGEIKWVNDSTQIRRDTQGEISHYEGIVYDITDRKQAEKEVSNLRKHLSNIIDSMPSVLVGVDTGGRVTLWNKTAEKTTGVPAREARGRGLFDLLPWLRSEKGNISESIRSKQVIQKQKRFHESEVDVRCDDITIYPLITDGMDGAVVRIDDVTEKVRMEEMVIQSEKMLSLGGLAAGMAHEINNPLAGILQNVAVLKNRLFGELPANRKAAASAGTTMAAIQQYLDLRKCNDMIEAISTSGTRAATLVNNTLAFARKSDHSISTHDLTSLLERTLALIQTDFDMKKNYDFRKIKLIKVYDEVGVEARCDPGKIQQVFLNLLKNGAEAMMGMTGNEYCPTFTLRVKCDDPWVRVEIEDNGPGIDEVLRRQVFDPFFTTKPVGKGTGLGLSVSYFIITEDHGGQLSVRTGNNGGAVFVIRLPKMGKESS
jgi:PAS domain S-box-containing protein